MVWRLCRLQIKSKTYENNSVISATKRVEAFQQQEQLSREMVEAFIDMITVYEDGRTEVVFRNMDELEAVLYQASERRKEDMRYAV